MKADFASNTEKRLLKAFKEGSQSSFDLIYNQLYTPLYNYGYRLCQNEELVKDCIQNVFIEIWQKRTSLGEIHALRYYLFKILRRKIFANLEQMSQAESKLKIAALSQNDFFLRFRTDKLETEHEVPEELVRKLFRAISQLTARQKEAVMLKYYENLTYAEISDVMDLKDAKYARQLVYRALDELRNAFSVEYGISHYGVLLYQVMSMELLRSII
jgi:RNA polymerase sigma factor (sigma-70 family)